MKTPRLPPDTDLARIAPLPADEKRVQLLKLKGGFSPWSYDPTRRRVPDILNAGGSLLESAGDTPLAIIEETIARECKRHPKGVASNLEVAKLAYDDFRKHPVEAIQQPFGRFYTTPGESAAYWSDVFLLIGDKPQIPFYDFRRGGGLNAAGAKFAASIMRLQIGEAYPEFAEAQLLLVQFPVAGRARSIRSRVLSNSDVFPFEELETMVAETRSIWLEINDERADEARRTGTGGGWWGG